MHDLDDLDLIRKLDPSDFLGSVEGLAGQVRDAEARARAADSLPDAKDVDSIAILGMGGSGISGDVAKTILAGTPLFIETVKGYQLPGWVDRNTLVFAMSYSGDTEETLAAFEEAGARRGARVVIVSTGGALSRWGREFDIPIVEIPPGLQPRAALGYLAIPILVVCERIGIAEGITPALAETIALLERRRGQLGRESQAASNPAKRLATDLLGRMPVIYGTEGIAAVAAYRLKCQFNEVSKIPAWWNCFPELNHNEVVGWKELAEVTRQSLALLVLRHTKEHPRNAKRIDATIPLIRGNLARVEEVRAEGDSDLARLFDLIYFGDFVSTYLALAQGVDPAPVEVIQALKKRLAEEDNRR